MIYLLLGADEYLTAEWLATQKAMLGDPELAGLNTVELSGGQTNAAQVLGEAAMMPFLCERRLLIVYGLLDAYEKRMAASKSDTAAIYMEMAQLLDGLRSVPETCVLVFVDNSVDKRRGLWKGYVLPAADGHAERRIDGLEALIKAGVVQQEILTAPDARTLPTWLQARARARNIAIDGAAVAMLCNFVGANLRQLDNELEKLALYTDGRPITAQDVRIMVADVSEELVWNLTDALSQRQGAKAMHALRELRRNDQSPIYLLSMIARQYRMLVEIKSVLATGQNNPDAIAKQLGYSAYPVKKAMQLVPQFTFEELEDILERLLEVDMAMKTGADQDTELDLLIADLAARRQPVRSR
ncbi:MAG TPA: DNA polymerase III subunit delta [Chloroflexi bacterium]|nr:DNA polymerase III subunit delta [Chloroflexota bacterium]